MLNGEWDVPWSVTLEVNSINRLRELMTVRVQHFLREGNTLADFFANLVFHFAGTIEFNQFQEVPRAGKAIINADKYGFPHLRTRQTNHPMSNNTYSY
uniref:Putative ovule protein n=1 Tax=Solanum chacoense TaxID=4108 RepID=A0A0V0HLT4_SOLCH